MAVVNDIIKIIYREIFTVTFLHAGYGAARPNFISDSITVKPDTKTKIIFENHSMDYRFFNNTLVVFLRCADQTSVIPYIKFGEDFSIRFLLISSGDFLNKTLIDAVGVTQFYQFSNQTNIGSGGFITMHTEGVNTDDLKSAAVVKVGENCLGVIDIYSNEAKDSTYELFNGGNENLNNPGYFIRFISRI